MKLLCTAFAALLGLGGSAWAELPATPVQPKMQMPAPPSPSTRPMIPRFVPKTITTGEIAMTGMRAQPVVVSTEEIAMTGMRAPPVTIDTEEITMTGLRGAPPEAAPLHMERRPE